MPSKQEPAKYKYEFEVAISEDGRYTPMAKAGFTGTYTGPTPFTHLCGLASSELARFFDRHARHELDEAGPGGTPDFAVKAGE